MIYEKIKQYLLSAFDMFFAVAIGWYLTEIIGFELVIIGLYVTTKIRIFFSKWFELHQESVAVTGLLLELEQSRANREENS